MIKRLFGEIKGRLMSQLIAGLMMWLSVKSECSLMNRIFVFLVSDINECEFTPCVANANCTDTDGSYDCVCNVGYSGNGFTGCNGELHIHLLPMPSEHMKL